MKAKSRLLHPSPPSSSSFIAVSFILHPSSLILPTWVHKLQSTTQEDVSMLLVLAIILLIAWLGGFLVFHVAGGLIHILIVIAIILFILHLVRGRR
ncbi:MAG TPA: lmo0937 family membrane protein [Thermoanaerobaculia bacterium]|nr:lmo0937 family membrane protein [Thermoanaerobaculia bacterium]